MKKTGETEGKGKNTQTYPRTYTESSVGLILSREWKEPVHEAMKESYSNMSRRRLGNAADNRLHIAPIG